MTATPHLTRRGDVFWWRRRLPTALAAGRVDPDQFSSTCVEDRNHSFTAPVPETPREDGTPSSERWLALSLRTACPREARRRARSLTAIADFAWTLGPMTQTAQPHADYASEVLRIFGRQIDVLQTLGQTTPRAGPDRAIAETSAEIDARSAILAAAGAASGTGYGLPGAERREPATSSASRDPTDPGPSSHGAPTASEPTDAGEPSRIDTTHGTRRDALIAEGRAAFKLRSQLLLSQKIARDSIRYVHDRPFLAAHRTSQHDARSVPPTAPHVGEDAPPVCDERRVAPSDQGLDRATASAASPFGTHEHAPSSPSAANTTAPSPDNETIQVSGAATDPAPALRRESLDETFYAWLDAKCAGYETFEPEERPDPKAGAKFRQTSRANVESTLEIMTKLWPRSGVPLATADFTRAMGREFVEILPLLPKNHGKSSKNRRMIRDLLADAERAEARGLAEAEAKIAELGLKGQTALHQLGKAKIARLRTATCMRHMRYALAVFDYAVRRGVIDANPLKGVTWSVRELKRRQANETSAARRPWREKLGELLATTVFRGGFSDRGDPLFWCPFMGESMGGRMEEILQLMTGDFGRRAGVDFIRFENTEEVQHLKSEESHREVPIPQFLIDLGLLKLVALRRAQGEVFLFPSLTRGKTKGMLSENFSKKYTNYRKKHNVYDQRHDFHSHRAGFFERLEDEDVPLGICAALMGHAPTDVTRRHYGRATKSIRILNAAMQRIKIDVSEVVSPFGVEDGH
ncbi:tyrosine-type recombinase/integrase [Rubrimonas cliftonensis]|uniref:Phage integrase family protein n=1 Tax=Rubrimonas cliftonensis TaxID=89524 RepID=A0A1H4GHP4_9RHOB|nr:tyrosine-type recombinase/integrase [Rubrimonas cliftonensis]SEB08388.1 Phage integrase family protein [Rubrimonas cliftonensis]